MSELDFMTPMGGVFWSFMIVLTLALIAGGYWLGGVVARKTDTGFGGFMILLLVTIMVASTIIPLAMFGALGNIMAVANPLAQVDESMFVEQGLDGFAQMLVAAMVALGSTVAFFVASVIGLARGRN